MDLGKLDLLEEDWNLIGEDRIRRESIIKEFQSIVVKKEIDWKQRSKIRWLKEEDRNTKFFS